MNRKEFIESRQKAKRPDPSKKYCTITLSCSQTERDQIKAAAEESNLTMTDYIRSKIFYDE